MSLQLIKYLIIGSGKWNCEVIITAKGIICFVSYKMMNEVRYIIRSQVINSFIRECQMFSLRLVFNGTQPHSLYKFTKDTEQVKPVTILAASF